MLKIWKKFLYFLFRYENNIIKVFKIPLRKVKPLHTTLVSLGTACFMAEALKKMGLRRYSSVDKRLNIVLNDFQDFFNKKDLFYVSEYNQKKCIYKNKRTDLVFNHDFLTPPQSFSEQYTKVNEKYERRIKRLINFMHDKNENILFCFGELETNFDLQKAQKVLKQLNQKFEANIDLLYISHNPNLRLYQFVKPILISSHFYLAEYNHLNNLKKTTKSARWCIRRILEQVEYKNKTITKKFNTSLSKIISCNLKKYIS